MENHILVISDPPHRDEEDVDLERVADLLGLDIYAARLKVRFAAPEIFAWAQPIEAAALTKGLREAGPLHFPAGREGDG